MREDNPLESPPQAGGMLVREIVRQAFLIAARDECGLATRDQTLRESLELPAQAKAAPFCHARRDAVRLRDPTRVTSAFP